MALEAEENGALVAVALGADDAQPDPEAVAQAKRLAKLKATLADLREQQQPVALN